MKKIIDSDAINPKHGNVNYLDQLTPKAKKNRHVSTEAENIIWQNLLPYRKTGFKFTRQKPVNRFILDFYCSELSLAIEIDGGSHLTKLPTDKLRDNFLEKIGIVTVRFTNEEIFNNLSMVNKEILIICSRLALSRGGARRAEGLK